MNSVGDPWGIEAYIQNRLNEFFSVESNPPAVSLIADTAGASEAPGTVSRRPIQTSLRKIGQIRLDLVESPSDLTVRVDLPGVSKNDIKIHLEQNNQVLSIEAERQEYRDEEFPKSKGTQQQEQQATSSQSQQLRYHYAERVFGRIARRVWLPTQVDENKVQSSFKDGVLEVRLGKKVEDDKRKRITLQ